MSLTPSSPPATRRRTPQGEATAERVLDAAEQLFAERGFAATGLRDVASAAGLRAPSLYNHFPNKEALYEAVLERALGPVLERLRAFLAAGADAYEEPRLVEDMMALLGRRPAVSRLLHREVLSGGHTANPLLGRWLRTLVEDGLTALRKSPSRGPWADDELPLLFFAMSNVFTGYFALAPGYADALGEEPFSRSALLRQTRFLRKLWHVVWKEPA